MRAGAKTVADGACAQPLVEAGEGVLGGGDRRTRTILWPIAAIRQGEFGLGGVSQIIEMYSH